MDVSAHCPRTVQYLYLQTVRVQQFWVQMWFMLYQPTSQTLQLPTLSKQNFCQYRYMNSKLMSTVKKTDILQKTRILCYKNCYTEADCYSLIYDANTSRPL